MKSIMEPINRSTHSPSLHGDDARKRRDPEDQINDYQAATRRSDYREGDSDSEYPARDIRDVNDTVDRHGDTASYTTYPGEDERQGDEDIYRDEDDLEDLDDDNLDDDLDDEEIDLDEEDLEDDEIYPDEGEVERDRDISREEDGRRRDYTI